MQFLFDIHNLITLAMLIPLAGAFLISRLDLEPNVREGVTLITAALLLVVNVLIYQSIPEAKDIQLVIAEPMPGLSIAFAVESFGVMFALIASGLWIVTSIYAIGYMRGHHENCLLTTTDTAAQRTT